MKKALLTLSFLAVALSFGCANSSSGRRGESVMSDAERARALLDLAAANIAEGDASVALQSLNESKSLDDEIPETYYLFALAYHQKDQKDLALQSIKRAIELRPTFSKAKNTLGRILLDMNRFAEAEVALKEAANDLTFNEAFLAKANLGILYFKKMSYEKAEPYLTASIREGGNSTCIASYYRGMIYLEKNKLDHALADFQRSSRNSCSRVTEAHLAQGQTLIRMKRYDQARAKMIEIQRLFPLTDAYDKASRYLKEIP